MKERLRIDSMASLKEHCDVDADTGCWTFRTRATTADGPRASVRMADGRTVVVRLRRLALIAAMGFKDPGRALVAFPIPTCWNDRCVCPRHVRGGTLAESKQLAAERGSFDAPERALRLIRFNEQRRKLDREQTAALIAFKGTNAEAAEAFGVSKSRAKALRRARRVCVPGRVNSVFNWSPA